MMDIQIPSMPQKDGKTSTAAHSNTSVRRKEIRAEVSPSPRAVKKDEPKIEKPEHKNEQEKKRNPRTVSSISPGS